MPAIESKPIPLGTDLPDFNLIGTDGGMNAPRDFADSKVMVVAFLGNSCEYSNAVVDRLVKLQEKYLDQGLIIIGINSNDPQSQPEEDLEHMTKFAQAHQVNFPYLVDETQDVAKAFGAVCTPDLFVYDRDRKLAYHGRVDDSWQDESKASQRDLQDAIEALLIGTTPREPQHPSLGCAIQWRV